MQSWHGRLETSANLGEPICLRDFLNQFRGEKRILGHVHPVTRPLVDMVDLAGTSVIQP